MSKTSNAIRKTAYLGSFLALAMVLSYLESLIPLPIAVPGIKLGLANGCIIILLYVFGPFEACSVNILRVILTSLLFTNLYAMFYSLAGAVLSLLVMILFSKSKHFSPIGVGIIGGLFHNIGQCAVAFLVTKTDAILGFLPILMAAGMICGCLTGILGKILYPKLKKIYSMKEIRG